MTSVPPSRSEAPDSAQALSVAAIPTSCGLTCLIYRRKPIPSDAMSADDQRRARREDELDRQWTQQALLAPDPASPRDELVEVEGHIVTREAAENYFEWRRRQSC